MYLKNLKESSLVLLQSIKMLNVFGFSLKLLKQLILNNKAKQLEQFSIECRKMKTKVITPASHRGHRQYRELIKADAKRGKTRAIEYSL